MRNAVSMNTSAIPALAWNGAALRLVVQVVVMPIGGDLSRVRSGGFRHLDEQGARTGSSCADRRRGENLTDLDLDMVARRYFGHVGRNGELVVVGEPCVKVIPATARRLAQRETEQVVVLALG